MLYLSDNNNKMSKTTSIIGIAVILALFVGGVWFASQRYKQEPLATATFSPVQASQFSLAGAGITSSQTTVQLSSFKLPDPAKTPISMSMFGDTGYGVLEPQTSRIENITFTGVTQNANGSATLTGVSRGISFYSPYNASTTLSLSHSGGATFILTNSAAFYGKEFLFANNIGTSTAGLIFSSTTPPRYDFHPTFTLNTQLIDKAYADALSFAGVATATESSFGGVWLATALKQASSTNGSPNSPFVLQSKNATSTPGNSTSLDVVVTQNNGKIHQGFLDLTQAFTFSGGLVSSGATNIAATLANPFTLNTQAYNFPVSQNASSTVLSTNGSGALTWEPQGFRTLFATSSVIEYTGGTPTTTIASFIIPANTMTTGNKLEIHASVWATFNASCGFSINFGSGSATTTYGFGTAQGGNSAGDLALMSSSIFATSSIAEQGTGTSFNSGFNQYGIAKNLNLVNAQSNSWIMSNISNINLAAQSYISIGVQSYVSLTGTSACYLNAVDIGVMAQ